MKKAKYTVVVGNVGTMEYKIKKFAIECYESYVALSRSNVTRAAGESVTMFEGDNIIMEYIGTIDEQADDI